MIDIHSHILHNVDDGPKSKEETIDMLEQAVQEGISEIISTSHALSPQYNVAAQTVEKQVKTLQEEMILRQIPLKIHVGHEVRLRDDLVQLLKEKKIYTLANSKYLLLELPSGEVPHYTVNMIHALLSEGIQPVIAHPERNRAIADKPNRLAKLISQGAIAQVTAGSLAGHFGRTIQKLCLELVDANLVHCYGSDVHNLSTRPFKFDVGLRYLEKHKRLDAVDLFLENNARIAEDGDVIILEPEDLQTRKWYNFFS